MLWNGAAAEAARVTVVDPEPRPADLSFPDDSAFAAPGHVEVRDVVVNGKRWGETPFGNGYVAAIDNCVKPRVVKDANIGHRKNFVDLERNGKRDTTTFLVHSDLLRPAKAWDKDIREHAKARKAAKAPK